MESKALEKNMLRETQPQAEPELRSQEIARAPLAEPDTSFQDYDTEIAFVFDLPDDLDLEDYNIAHPEEFKTLTPYLLKSRDILITRRVDALAISVTSWC